MKYHYLLVLALIVFLGVSHYLGYTPIALWVIFFLASGIAYILYAKDKVAAKAGSWRVSENTLHVAALLFGWPGALIAQERLRHKTQKQSFRSIFWISVLVNLAGIAWFHSPQGNLQLREGLHQFEHLIISNVSHKAPVSTVLFLTKFRKNQVDWLLPTSAEHGIKRFSGQV